MSAISRRFSMNPPRVLIPVFLLLFSLAPLSVSARIIGVPGTQPTIQAGINASSPGDTVLVQPGAYPEYIDFKGKNIVVGSLFLTTRDSTYIIQTKIDAGMRNTVVTFQSGETSAAELCGFTLTNGFSLSPYVGPLPKPNPGGGICCKNASPFLHHLIVDGNVSQIDGGGIYLENSNSMIEYSVIRNNRANGYGGAINIYKGDNKIKYCVIENNIGYGGSISCYLSTVLYFKNLIIGNKCDSGLEINTSDVNILNCTLANNRTPAINISYSDVNIINSIYWDDTTYHEEIFISRDNSHPERPISHVRIAYSDIIGGKNKVICVNDSLYYESNNINYDPLFNGDYSLSKNSPCIDSGTAFYKTGDSVVLDLKKGEYFGIAPDIGAFESNYALSVLDTTPVFDLSLSNFPNPFNTTTTINFSLVKPSYVRLSVYSITGQKVIDLLEKNLAAGNYQTQWNGRDESGKLVSSGVYFVRLDKGAETLTKRVVFMK
jgi:hypothetical protein